MKLYLSSFRLGDHPQHLVALLPPAARVAVICNAIDGEDFVGWVQTETSGMSGRFKLTIK